MIVTLIMIMAMTIIMIIDSYQCQRTSNAITNSGRLYELTTGRLL